MYGYANLGFMNKRASQQMEQFCGRKSTVPRSRWRALHNDQPGACLLFSKDIEGGATRERSVKLNESIQLDNI